MLPVRFIIVEGVTKAGLAVDPQLNVDPLKDEERSTLTVSAEHQVADGTSGVNKTSGNCFTVTE